MPRNKYQQDNNRESRRHRDGRDSAQARRGRERHLSVRSVRRDQPDTRKIARAVIALALAEAEAEAAAEAQAAAELDATDNTMPDATPDDDGGTS